MIDKQYLDKIALLLIDVAEGNNTIHEDVKKMIKKQEDLEQRIKKLEDTKTMERILGEKLC